MTSIRFHNPATIHPPRGYSHVAEVDAERLVFIAGQVALDVQGAIVGAGDMGAQATQVFENLKAALQVVGADFSHVVKFTIFTTDMEQLPRLREVRDRYIDPRTPPASTAVEVRRLFHPDIMLEIEAVAVVPVLL